MRALPTMSSNFFLCITNYGAAVVLLPFWLIMYSHGHVSLAPDKTWLYFMLACSFLLLSRELYFYAYSRTDIANITVFSALTPIYTLATGYILLDETPSLLTILGIFMITLAIYYIFLPANVAKESRLAHFIKPFMRISTSLPILCGFLSTIPTAFGAIYQKKTLFHMDIASFSLSLFLVLGTAALIIELLKRQERRVIYDNMAILRKKSFWCSAFLLMVMHVSFAPILMSHNSAAALTLQRCSILFQIIFAYYFLHQKEDIRKRIFAGVIIIMGFLLIWNG
jgi:drug/metabolite transporter (DMT)-like permease